jgi:hypothetical protein
LLVFLVLIQGDPKSYLFGNITRKEVNKMKKSLGIIAGSAMLLAMVIPAFASRNDYDNHSKPTPTPEPVVTNISVDNTNTYVTEEVSSSANTGNNVQTVSILGVTDPKVESFSFRNDRENNHSSTGTVVDGVAQGITTGDAQAITSSTLKVNTTVFSLDCNCFKNIGSVRVNNNGAYVLSGVTAGASTNANTQIFGVNGVTTVKGVSQGAMTGTAGAQTITLTKVNWTVIK